MPRTNYRQVKKQKELSRKARQLEKQQRRTTRPGTTAETETALQEPPVGAGEQASSAES